MSEPVATRVIEICPGEWIVQFEGGLNGWTKLGDETFASRSEAEAYEQDQIDSADFGGGE